MMRGTICIAVLGIAAVFAAPALAEVGNRVIETTTLELLGEEGARNYADALQPDENVGWTLYVPENYSNDRPAGLFVYISPSDSGRMPSRWSGEFDDRNLIWIAANESGNERQVARRMALALLAVGVAHQEYAIDRTRIYLSGFSGGARVAALMTPRFAHLFKGAIYIGGAESWEAGEVPERIEAMQANRYVFMAGSHDFNRSMVLSARDTYSDSGIENLDTVLMPRTGHELPNPGTFGKALDFLDRPDTPVE